MSVPEDVSVTGFDDSLWASVSDPPLTTVAQDAGALGRAAIALLRERLAGGPARRDRLPVRLVARSSTAPPRSGPPP